MNISQGPLQGRDLVEEVLAVVNEARAALNIPPVIDPLLDNLVDVYKSTIIVQDVIVENKNDDEAVGIALNKLNEVLSLNDSDSELFWIRNTLLNKAITHLDAHIGAIDDENCLVLDAYFKYLEIEPIGNIIDGDLVIQGSCLNPHYGPVLCIVEFAMEGLDQFNKAIGIPPWNMIFTPAVDKDSFSTFSIPISLGLDYKRGSLRASIYVDNIEKIPYREEKKDFKVSSELYICAWECTARDDDAVRSAVEHLGVIPEEDVAVANTNDEFATPNLSYRTPKSNRSEKDLDTERHQIVTEEERYPEIITDIRVVHDYDEIQALKQEGYELDCIQLTPEGVQHDQEFLWKFYVMVAYSPYGPDTVGIEDVKWYRCLKSKSEIHSIPGYDLLIDHDLSSNDDENSVFLAIKTGTKQRIRSLAMISTSLDDDTKFYEFIDHQQGKFQQAPHEIGRSFGNHSVGLLLEYFAEDEIRQWQQALRPENTLETEETGLVDVDNSHRERRNVKSREGFEVAGGMPEYLIEDFDKDENKEEEEKGYVSRSRPFSREVANDINDINAIEDESDSEKSEYVGSPSKDMFEEERENIEFLQKRYDIASSDYERLLSENYELQKKAALYIAKEKLKQSQNQNIAMKTAMELAQQTYLEGEGMKDIMIEKQKQFESTMKSLQEMKAKLIRQDDEFSQLALDLQTRLDDKEFKVMEIGNSFMTFKREILSKAIYSRTGRGISTRMMKSFEISELKREEELEKVRLRNISLRTTLKKLERTLRAKEQLAEGLHLMDFEQLKIENQSLNEKIEERNEELAKLKQKKTFTVQVLTHIREKLRYYRNYNGVLANELAEIDNEIMSLRSVVNESKHVRDVTRAENKDLRLKQGFATNIMLVRDFENRKHTIEQMKLLIKDCQEQYAILLDQLALETTTKPMSSPLKSVEDKRRSGSASGHPGTLKLGNSFSRKDYVGKKLRSLI